MNAKAEKLQQLKAVELEILKSIVDVCKQLNIRYYVLVGTLIGAIRHQGFIPWDDDIDIGMVREDYELFMKEAQKLLPDHLFVQNIWTDEGYLLNFGKVRNSNTTFIEKSVKNHKINHGVYVDIFPLDYYPEDPVEQERICAINKRYKRRIAIEYSVPNRTWKNKIMSLFLRIRYPSCRAILKKQEKMFRSVPKGSLLTSYYGYKGETAPVEWYGEGTVAMFEGMEVVVPSEYDKLLTQIYGDYMTPPPEDQRVARHYTEVIDLEKPYTYYLTEQTRNHIEK